MNRQVPDTQKTEPIAIIGNGKMAKHMIRYFELVGQPFIHWFRHSHITAAAGSSKLAIFKQKINKIFKPSDAVLNSALAKVNKVLLLIADDQIEKFIQNNQTLNNKTVIHFSGSLAIENVPGCHPLMTFGEDLYDLDQYQSIPFVVDEGVQFSQLFPLLKNQVYTIKPEQKNLYHALCAMAGNYSQLLWLSIGKELEKLDLPADLMSVYLKQNTENFVMNPETAATGPFVRGDFDTIKAHQKALLNHSLENTYQAFYALNQQVLETRERRQL